MSQRDPYKRNVSFQSGVMQNAQRNFADWQRKVQQNRALKEKLKEQEQANSGVNFVPDSITAEFDPSLNPMKSRVNEYITEFGLKHASQLDPKSDQFDNTIAVKYNRLKVNGIELLQSMNKSMGQYGTIKKGLADGSIDFEPDEYEKLTKKYEWIQNLDPSQIGHDIGGNITIAELDEDGNEVFNQFSNNENFDFSATVGAAKEINYVENFMGRMKGTDDSDPTQVVEMAITMSGGRDSQDYLGMVQDVLKSKYPNATEEALENMTKDPKYQKEAEDYMSDNFTNIKKSVPKTGSTGYEQELRRESGVKSMLDLEGYQMGRLQEDGTLSPQNEAKLRARIDQEYASHGTRFKETEKEFMESIGYTNWTEEEFKEEWYQTKVRDTATPEAKDLSVASGGKAFDGEVRGTATFINPATNDDIASGGYAHPELMAEGRFVMGGNMFGDYGFGEGREDQVYKNPMTFTDSNGWNFMSYSLQDQTPIEYTIPDDSSALILGARRGYDLGKGETESDNRTMWGAEGSGQFTATGVFNQIPVAKQPITIPGYIQLGKKSKGNTGLAVPGEEYVIPIGGAIPDEVMEYLKSKKIDISSSIKMGNFIKGEWKQKGHEKAPVEILLPAGSVLKNDLTRVSNHNFNNMTSIKYNLEQRLLDNAGHEGDNHYVASWMYGSVGELFEMAEGRGHWSIEYRTAASEIIKERQLTPPEDGVYK